MWKHYSKAGWAGGAVWAHCLANWKVQMGVQTPRSPLGLGERQPDIISEGSARADGAGAGAPPAMAREVAWRRFLALPRSLVPSGLKRRKKKDLSVKTQRRLWFLVRLWFSTFLNVLCSLSKKGRCVSQILHHQRSHWKRNLPTAQFVGISAHRHDNILAASVVIHLASFQFLEPQF